MSSTQSGLLQIELCPSIRSILHLLLCAWRQPPACEHELKRTFVRCLRPFAVKRLRGLFAPVKHKARPGAKVKRCTSQLTHFDKAVEKPHDSAFRGFSSFKAYLHRRRTYVNNSRSLSVRVHFRVKDFDSNQKIGHGLIGLQYLRKAQRQADCRDRCCCACYTVESRP